MKKEAVNTTTYIYEVDKVGILRVDHISEVLGTGHTHLALAVRHNNGPVVLIEENLSPGSSRQD